MPGKFSFDCRISRKRPVCSPPPTFIPNFGLCAAGCRPVITRGAARFITGSGPTRGVHSSILRASLSLRNKQRVRGSEPREGRTRPEQGSFTTGSTVTNGERTVKGCRRREPGPRSLGLTQHASDDQRFVTKGRYAPYRRCRRHRSSTRPRVIQCRARVDARGWAATSRRQTA